MCVFVFHTIYLHFSQHKLKKFLFSTDYHNVLVLDLVLSEEGILPLSVSSSYGTYVCLSVRPSICLSVCVNFPLSLHSPPGILRSFTAIVRKNVQSREVILMC